MSLTYPGYPNATHYSPHFSRAELDCHCGCKTPPEVEHNLATLALNLEVLRTKAGHALSPSNAYRCLARNTAAGGKPKSYHMQGKAADVTCAPTHADVDKLATIAEQVPAFKAGGIGRYYDGHGFFVHVDFGPRVWRGINGV